MQYSKIRLLSEYIFLFIEKRKEENYLVLLQIIFVPSDIKNSFFFVNSL